VGNSRNIYFQSLTAVIIAASHDSINAPWLAPQTPCEHGVAVNTRILSKAIKNRAPSCGAQTL